MAPKWETSILYIEALDDLALLEKCLGSDDLVFATSTNFPAVTTGWLGSYHRMNTNTLTHDGACTR
jgi:hypothetical protein